MNTITFEDYKEQIKAKFQTIKRVGLYGSGDLSNVTPAQLRDLCLRIAESRLSTNDAFIFNYYFGVTEPAKLIKAIENFEIGKFKSVIYFLKGEKNSENRNRIELAAILVDFAPRPFSNYFANEGKCNTETVGVTNLNDKSGMSLVTASSEMVVVGKIDRIKRQYKKVIALGLVASSMGLAVYSWFPKKECMQWQDDHYELVDCSNETIGVFDNRIPVQNEKLGLKKLDSDTIKKYFENGNPKVWYCKIDGKLELFNQPGLHPTSGKTLKPITRYMIKKYLKP